MLKYGLYFDFLLGDSQIRPIHVVQANIDVGEFLYNDVLQIEVLVSIVCDLKGTATFNSEWHHRQKYIGSIENNAGEVRAGLNHHTNVTVGELHLRLVNEEIDLFGVLALGAWVKGHLYYFSCERLDLAADLLEVEWRDIFCADPPLDLLLSGVRESDLLVLAQSLFRLYDNPLKVDFLRFDHEFVEYAFAAGLPLQSLNRLSVPGDSQRQREVVLHNILGDETQLQLGLTLRSHPQEVDQGLRKL